MDTKIVSNSDIVKEPILEGSSKQEVFASKLPDYDQSKLESIRDGDARSFVSVITDPIVAAANFVARSIRSFFGYIAACFCGNAEEVKAKQIAELNELKGTCENALDYILNKRDEWAATFDALPAILQDALIKADIKDILKGDIKKGRLEEKDVEAEVEKRFNDKTQKAESINIIRNFHPIVLKETHTSMPKGSHNYAYEDQFVPSYLQHMIAKINNDLRALQA